MQATAASSASNSDDDDDSLDSDESFVDQALYERIRASEPPGMVVHACCRAAALASAAPPRLMPPPPCLLPPSPAPAAAAAAASRRHHTCYAAAPRLLPPPHHRACYRRSCRSNGRTGASLVMQWEDPYEATCRESWWRCHAWSQPLDHWACTWYARGRLVGGRRFRWRALLSAEAALMGAIWVAQLHNSWSVDYANLPNLRSPWLLRLMRLLCGFFYLPKAREWWFVDFE